MTRIPINFPLGGLSDDDAYSAQKPGTTREAVNVRGIDPVTGRTRGAQREGMSKYIATQVDGSGGVKIQDIAVVTRDSPKTDWANLDTAGIATDAPEWVRQTAEGSTVWWVAVDLSENVYILDGESAVTKYNSDGVKLRTIPVPLPDGHTLVRKIVVDADGGVYAASYQSEYEAGRIWRFVDSTINGLELELAWEHEVEGGGVEMIDSDLYSLHYVAKFGTGQVDRSIRRLDSIITSLPTETWVASTPGPVNGLEIGQDGSIKVAVGESTNKGAGADRPFFSKQEASTELWSPHLLNNAQDRIYFWVDASNIDLQKNASLTQGDPVELWRDRRHYDTTDGFGSYPVVADKTVRDLFRAGADAGTQRAAPTFGENIFGNLPGVFFDASADGGTPAAGSTLTGSALRSYRNGTVTAKTAAGDSMPDQRAVFPGYTAASYITCIVVKPFQVSTQRHFLSQSKGSGALDIGLLSSTYFDDAGTNLYELSLGEMAYHDKSSTTGISNAAYTDSGAGDTPREINFGNEAETIVLTIVHNGATVTQSWFRANGEDVDEFTFGDSTTFSAADDSYTLIGCRRSASDDAKTGDLYDDTDTFGTAALKLASFSGYVAEIITVLADSAGAGVHDAWIDAGPGAGPGGLTAKREAGIDADIASEVERLEGYLAHKWGVSHLFPHYSTELSTGGTSGQSSVSLAHMSNHPFGGTGAWPVRTDLADADLAKQLARRDLWRPEPVTARFHPGSAAVAWAMYGSGLGNALVTSDDARVLSVGIKPNWTPGTTTPIGIDNKDETDLIMRAVRDRGARYAMDRPSRGFISFVSQVRGKASAFFVPSDGVTVFVDDGQGNTETFEFNVVDPSNANTHVSTASGSAETTMNGLRTAIAAGSLLIDVYDSGPYTCTLINQADGTSGNEDITTNTAAEIIVYGMVDGETEDDVWVLADGTYEPDQPGVGIGVDEEGDFWVPWVTSNTPERAEKRDRVDGTSLATYDVATTQSIYCVALPLSHPAYIDQSPTPTGPVHMYLGTSGGELDPQVETLHKIRLVSEDQELGGAPTPRATRILAVTSGSVYEVSTPDTRTLKGSGFELEALSPYIFSTVAFNDVFWCDGTGYVVYDSQEDTLVTMTSKSAGSLPKSGKLIETWRGRLVIGRTEDDPHNVYMSRVGDPFNWNEFPAVPDTLEAVSFGQSRVGLSPDIINGLVPYNDDLLIIGGDHTIQRLTGDPNAGGQLDLVSDITGMAYGRAWCKNPSGVLFFFGSKGGVYAMTPGGIPERITRDRIERRMSEFDLSEFMVRLVWNYRAEGLHVFLVPYDQPSLGIAGATAWFMDKSGAWWEDEFARSDESPTAAAVVDGDLPADRVLLIGGADGYLRQWDETAKDDDGQRIDSRVLIGPLAPPSSTSQIKFTRPQVCLGSEQSGCDFEWFASDTAELTGLPVASGKLGPGMNPTLGVRTRGAACWLRLRNAAVSERWAFERMTVDVASGGRERVR